MLAIQRSSDSSAESKSTKCTPNVLPCTIHHTGPIEASDRYWKPSIEKEIGTDASISETAAESQTAYFRGRKLKGKAVKIPSGYEGLLLQSTSKTLPQEKPQRAPSPEDDDLMIVEQEDEPEPVKILELVGSFDDVLVWDHEAVPESDSAMVKGVEEWIRFAEAMHKA